MNLTKATTMCSVALLVSSFALRAGAQCPTAGAAPGCNEVITEGAGGTFTVVGISANGTNYDGSDDALVGFVNHTGAPVYSISLNGNGTDIFGFDGDGIDSFGVTGNSTDLTGYGGPNAYFTKISTDFTQGTVNFLTPVADGGSAFFSLEESFNASNPPTPSPTPTPTSVTPEPNSLVLLGSGMLGWVGILRRRVTAR